ncbi:MAG: hypothetical protein KGO96_07515 [Elusimicrobia bacterium]|nr:hypothetical protein [Elusimicrobiota bacterium]
MPLFYFKCPYCNTPFSFLLKNENDGKDKKCKNCNIPLIRTIKSPNIEHKEVLDNGAMVRKVERLVDSEEIFKERSKTDSTKSD